MTDTTVDTDLIVDPPVDDDRLIVRVDLHNSPDDAQVEVPGLGLFTNHEEKRVDEVQVALYNAQPFDRKISPNDQTFVIEVPEPQPDDEVEDEPDSGEPDQGDNDPQGS